ncbi:hypothetical protein [Streptomyces sp. H27-D2]|uniref:hypothetical protein n=1 Tax=Streptomyces sp. H27-D2 TaxID=3046304 RepID=UPI002DBC5E85|nr:hypothetical protein [Streptomyces sp. H27-D2]MEC4018252.1 hypothetical protein [Streptomyces sp. H27-D2]
MSDQYAHPQPTDSGAWGSTQPPAPAPAAATTPPAAMEPHPAPPAPAPPVLTAQHVWVDGYEPGNPWQARLCVQSPYGTVVYPLTPNTMPELLESLVVVAQEQQGIPVGFEESDAAPETDRADGADRQQDAGTPVHSGRAARVTGWAVVHELWEREDPTARLIMGAVVIGLLLLGVFLA